MLTDPSGSVIVEEQSQEVTMALRVHMVGIGLRGFMDRSLDAFFKRVDEILEWDGENFNKPWRKE